MRLDLKYGENAACILGTVALYSAGDQQVVPFFVAHHSDSAALSSAACLAVIAPAKSIVASQHSKGREQEKVKRREKMTETRPAAVSG